MVILAENKKAGFDYEILETLEVGIVLTGQEVKSIREGRVSLAGSFVTIRNSELWLTNVVIPAWQPKNAPHDYSDTRSKKLLAHREQVDSLIGKIKTKGLTVLPLRLYTQHGKIKVEIGVAKYRKKQDKREIIKKRDIEREIERTL